MKKTYVVAILLLFAGMVHAQAPTSLQYPTPNAYIANVSSVYLAPTLAGSTTGLVYSITPAFPGGSGLNFNTATGVISGIPAVAIPSTSYTITATNNVGSKSTAVVIGVTTNTFNNAADSIFFLTTDTLRKVGNGTATGDIILYRNVRNINGQAIDCIVKTRFVSTGATFSSYDQPLPTDGSTFNSNNPRFFSPQLTFPNGGGNVIFDFQFIAGGTYVNATQSGTNITLQNVKINTYDIDGNGTALSNQVNSFAGFDTSEVSSATTIRAAVFDVATGLTKYESNISTNNLTVTADATRVRLTYKNLSDFTIQVATGATGAAYFFLDFSSGPLFSTAQASTPPVIDLNTILPGVGNSTTGCATALAFTASGQPNNVTSGTVLTELSVTYDNTASNIRNGASEQLVIAGSTAGTAAHALNFTTGSTSNVTVGGVNYTITKSVSGTENKIAFRNGATTFTVAQAEALLDALSYSNVAASPTSGDRRFIVNVRNTQFISPDATFIATIGCVSISGNIYHDANGLSDSTVNANGPLGQFAAAGAYAVLTNTTGTVLATVPILAGGAFNFGRVDPGAYNIYVSNTATPGANVTAPTYPTAGNYKSTGENLGAPAGYDGLIDGKIPVTVGTISVTNANIGIQIPPVTADSTYNTVLNPGGFNNFAVSPAAFKTSDVDGTIDSLVITSFPTGANYLKVGSVVYINGGNCPPQSTCVTWPGTLRLPISAINSIAVDPTLPGNTSVVISYVALDNARFASNNNVPASITIPFNVPATPITISGNVWNDANGDGVKAAAEAYTAVANSGEALYAYLIQTTNTYSGAPTIYAATPVTAAATGYTFTNVPGNNVYEIRIATQSGTPVAGAALTTVIPALATNYSGVSTNNNGAIVANQQTLSLLNGLGTVNGDRININFGIEQIPVADPKAFTAPATSFTLSPTVTINGQMASSINGNSTSLVGSPVRSLSGNDAEDCAAASSCATGKTYIIQTIRNNTALYYNFGSGPVLVTPGTTIINFDPANLTIYGQAGQGLTGPTALGFTYSLVDNANIPSPAVTYTIQTTGSALAVKLSSFTGKVNNCIAALAWVSESEINSKNYTVEQSEDGINYNAVSVINSNNNPAGGKYSSNVAMLGAVNYFRLKMTDLDGSVAYSTIVTLRSAACGTDAISVVPNPATDNIRILGLQVSDNVSVYDAAGKVVLSFKATISNQQVNIAALAAGIYVVKVVDKNNVTKNSRLIKK